MEDIAGKMLSAIVDEDNRPTGDGPSLIEMKAFIVSRINDLSLSDKKEVGAILVMNGRQNDIKSCAQGSLVDLDRLPERLIEQMYELINYKLNNKKVAV